MSSFNKLFFCPWVPFSFPSQFDTCSFGDKKCSKRRELLLPSVMNFYFNSTFNISYIALLIYFNFILLKELCIKSACAIFSLLCACGLVCCFFFFPSPCLGYKRNVALKAQLLNRFNVRKICMKDIKVV